MNATDLAAVQEALQIASRHFDNESVMTCGMKRELRAKASRLRRISRDLARRSTKGN